MRVVRWIVLFVVVAVAGAGPRVAAADETTITVNTTSAVVNIDLRTGQVADLPGRDGKVSLREATIAASNTPGPHTIKFNIPTTDPNYNAEMGVFFITIVPTDARLGLILGDDNTTIDGFTQNAFMGQPNDRTLRIAIQGTTQTTAYSGLRIDSNGNSIRGLWLTGYSFGIEIIGANNRVVSSSLTRNYHSGIHVTGNNNTIGGTAAGEGNQLLLNLGSGISINGAGNRVVGNIAKQNHSAGISIRETATKNLIGGITPAARNVVITNGHYSSGRTPVGAQIALSGTYNVVRGNYIGVDESGMQPAGGAASSGIAVTGSYNTIGGTTRGTGNVISGHTAYSYRVLDRPAGIRIGGGNTTHNITIQGNLIGTGADGTTAVPNERGIVINDFLFNEAPSRVRIGGTTPGSANTIAFNKLEGIIVYATAPAMPSSILIAGNAIYGNGLIGIDLGADGVTPNDTNDVDSGPNKLLNFPIITQATSDQTVTTVRGRVEAALPATITVEVFANDAPDATGYGEGQVFLGRTTPDANGDFAFDLAPGMADKYITAKAWDGTGNTSEFSLAQQVVAP